MQPMPRSSSSPAEAGVVIPVRSFTHGKSRLLGTLGAAEHEAFVRHLADRAVAAATRYRTVVVTSAPEVVEWASGHGLSVIADRGSLDAAASDGRAWVADQGCTRVVVVHADLPDVVTLDAVAGEGAGEGAVAFIVPCHRSEGTPVLSIPVAAPFEFAYGRGSFERHRAEARRVGLEARIVLDHGLSFDIDGPEDLRILDARHHRKAPER
jgi:2-phospho-L-lactate guanylyltransferase